MADLAIPPNDRLAGAEMLGTVLILHWRDGHRGELPLETLRRNCPCAVCRGAREKKSPLKVLTPIPTSELNAIQAVGRYAFQLFWRDGHATGIYDFELLRQLCQCPDCDDTSAP